MQAIIVGNGAISLMVAKELVDYDPSLHLKIVAPKNKEGCASIAAAAMFNSFAELEPSTLKNSVEKEKWLFNKQATQYWPHLLNELEEINQSKMNYGFGTYLINNTISDSLEDRNFDAIEDALKMFEQPFQRVNPNEIPQYNPEANARANRAIFIEKEGWINPNDLMKELETYLTNTNRVQWIDQKCLRVLVSNCKTKVIGVETDQNDKILADFVFLAPGANFSEIVKESHFEFDMPKIFYGIGCTILLKTNEHTLTNCVRSPNRGLACGTYSAPRSSSTVVIGASNLIHHQPSLHARATSVYSLLKAAMEQINYHYYKAELLSVNVGWRPTSEDTIPLIGATPLSQLYVATGTKRDGLHCSPLIAKCIRELIYDGKSKSANIDLFTPHRKPIHYLTREEAITNYVNHNINALYQHDFKPAKNSMQDYLMATYRKEIEDLHDSVGAIDWGIPAELTGLYKHQLIKA